MVVVAAVEKEKKKAGSPKHYGTARFQEPSASPALRGKIWAGRTVPATVSRAQLGCRDKGLRAPGKAVLPELPGLPC